MAALGSAAGSGLLAANAAAQVARRDDDESPPPLLLAHSNQSAPVLLAHRSGHSSHRSHHSSHGGGSTGHGRSGGVRDDSTVPEPEPPPPPPPKPAHVSFVAYPGGRIFIDDKSIGRDASGTLVLKPGTYTIRVENRFVGTHTEQVEITEGQTGEVTINW